MEEQKKKQKPAKKTTTTSMSYTLKAITQNIIKLEEAGYISLEDGKIMNEIKKKALDKYIQEQFG